MRAAPEAVLLAVLLAVPTILAHTTDVLEVQAVPETAAEAQLTSASSPTAGSYGSYGGYGVVDGQQGYGYGYGYGRSLIEDSSAALEPSDPLLEYAERQQAQQDAQQMAAQEAGGGVSAAAVAAIAQARAARSSSSSQLVPVPAGRCYCRFDTDFNTWALAEDACKEALYARCQTDGPLPCGWLDAFFTPPKGPGHVLPHENDIKAFLHEDCSPQPPCACTGVKFDGTDSIPAAVACCRDLKVACLTPFSGVQCHKVDAFCHEDKPAPVLAAWSQHVLRHSDCSSYNGLPYELVTLHALQAAAAPKKPAALTEHKETREEAKVPEAVLLGQLLQSMEQQQSSKVGCVRQQRGLLVTLAAITAAAVCVAIVAVVFAVRRPATLPIASAAPPIRSADGSATDVYQSLLNSTALAAPRPAACVGAGLQPPLYQDGSGNSCLSRVISISHLRNALREPLLSHPISR